MASVEYTVADGVVTAAGIALQDGEYTRKLVAAAPDSTARSASTLRISGWSTSAAPKARRWVA